MIRVIFEEQKTVNLETDLCHESVAQSREVVGCWLVDLDERRLIAKHVITSDASADDAILRASLAWTRQQGSSLTTQGMIEANLCSRESAYYFKTTELTRYSVVLATRGSMSPGIGWSMTRRLSARFQSILQESRVQIA